MNRDRDTKLPKTNCRIPMPLVKEFGEKICENCDKEDVCMYRDECMKAVKDILDIEERTNVFIKTHTECKKLPRGRLPATHSESP